jgi:hypothetical protein
MRSFLEGTVEWQLLAHKALKMGRRKKGRANEEKIGIWRCQEDQDEDIWSTNYGLYTVTH